MTDDDKLWKFSWSTGLSKGSLMILHYEVWISNPSEERIILIKEEKAYKRFYSMTQGVPSDMDSIEWFR